MLFSVASTQFSMLVSTSSTNTGVPESMGLICNARSGSHLAGTSLFSGVMNKQAVWLEGDRAELQMRLM